MKKLLPILTLAILGIFSFGEAFAACRVPDFAISPVNPTYSPVTFSGTWDECNSFAKYFTIRPLGEQNDIVPCTQRTASFSITESLPNASYEDLRIYLWNDEGSCTNAYDNFLTGVPLTIEDAPLPPDPPIAASTTAALSGAINDCSFGIQDWVVDNAGIVLLSVLGLAILFGILPGVIARMIVK